MARGETISDERRPDALLAAIDLWCAFLKAAGSAEPALPRYWPAEAKSRPGPVRARAQAQ